MTLPNLADDFDPTLARLCSDSAKLEKIKELCSKELKRIEISAEIITSEYAIGIDAGIEDFIRDIMRIIDNAKS